MSNFIGNATDFKTYHDERQNVYDADDDNEIEKWLLVASEWMDATYREYLTGVKVGEREQEREQPRSGQTDAFGYSIASDTVPREWINATYEIALKHGNTPGILNSDYTPGKYDSVSIDGAVSVKFTKFRSVADIQTKFSKVGQIMSTLVSGRSKSGSLSGGSSRA